MGINKLNIERNKVRSRLKYKANDIEKPWRVPTVHSYNELPQLKRMVWTVITEDPKKSFSLYTGTEWSAMHLWRTNCDGSPIIEIKSREPNI